MPQVKKQNNVSAVINAEGRAETLAGINYQVFPVVMVVEKVMNGLMYPGDVLQMNPANWDGSPVVWPAHPSNNDEPWISANTPAQFDKNVVGFLFNSATDQVDGKTRLTSEIWIDPARAESQGHADLMPALEGDDPVEVSIGLYFFDDETPGTFEGDDYEASVTVMFPDHLAVLRDEPGACSVEEGCGTGVNAEQDTTAPGVNAENEKPEPESPSGINNCNGDQACEICLGKEGESSLPVANKIKGNQKEMPKTSAFAKILAAVSGKTELTEADKAQIAKAVNVKVRALMDALEAATAKTLGDDEYAWVREADTDSNKYWYESGGVTYERSFEMDAAGQVTIGADPVEVVGTTMFVPVATSAKETTMTDKTAAPEGAENKDTVEISTADNELFQAWKAEAAAKLDELRKQVINATANTLTVDQVANMDKATLEALLAALVAKEEKEAPMEKEEEGDMKKDENASTDANSDETASADANANAEAETPAADFSGKGGGAPAQNKGKNIPPSILNREFFNKKKEG